MTSDASKNAEKSKERPEESITLIDDDETSHFYLRVLLRISKPDLSIQTFSGASEVLSLIKAKNFRTNAILLDINMPVLSGWEFLQKIKELNFSVPVYMLTSSVDIRDRQRVKEFNNVLGFFVKPLSRPQLNEILIKHFR